jgi:hypothetical protein
MPGMLHFHGQWYGNIFMKKMQYFGSSGYIMTKNDYLCTMILLCGGTSA